MKNIKDRINSQLFKAQEIELSAEKVELSDIKTLKKLISMHEKAIVKIKALEQEKQQFKREAEQARKESFKAATDVVRVAETLGLKGKDIPEVVELFRISKESLELAKDL